ncbi:amidase domain-containing protein [Paenibacillus chungangensis]|uniref:Amidase domain-containing protein n=1 Tax=Paenibacillus chungangensis TaxID=696535 RepID=A0ABW3HUT2_9BACL
MAKSGGRGPQKNRQHRTGKPAASEKRTASAAQSRRSGQAAIHNVSGGIEPVKQLERKKVKLSTLLETSAYSGGHQGGEHSWKAAIDRYVSLYNQAETEQHARALSDYIEDDIHEARLSSKMARLRERDLLRGVLPAGSQTEAQLLRVNESGSEVSVQVRLHIKRRMEHSGRYYMEERYELERLWLYVTEGSWSIRQVEPQLAERRSRYGSAAHQWLAESEASANDSLILTPSLPYLNYDLLPQFKNRHNGIRYRRDLAAAYADRWWNEGNPAFELFEVNCTNYVSQCIFAGNAPMNYTGRRESGWWYKGRMKGGEWWSYSWAVSHALTNYLAAPRKTGLRAIETESARELQLGDVIVYDWNGDNRFQHSTIVTAFDAAGEPLVNANTVASRHRYWDYKDSYAWTEGTRYRFFHIPDLL